MILWCLLILTLRERTRTMFFDIVKTIALHRNTATCTDMIYEIQNEYANVHRYTYTEYYNRFRLIYTLYNAP